MIESGLSIWMLGNPAITSFLGQTPTDKSNGIYSAFYFSVLPKEPTGAIPGIVLDRMRSTDAEDTLDARAALPGDIIEGRFQFGSVASDGPQNPNQQANGYLAACALSRALRRQLTGLATGRAILPDVSGKPAIMISDVFDWDEFDAHVEVGGYGYLMRRILQVTIVFQELT
jgi:hypothetical protein